MWPSLVLMKNEANCSLQSNVGPEHANITSRSDFVCSITHSSDDAKSRSFELCRLILAICIRYSHLNETCISDHVFCLPRRRFPFLYYSGLFPRESFHDIRRVITPATSQFATLVGVQFLLYNEEGEASDNYIGSLCFDHAVGGMLFRLPPLSVNVLGKFGSYRIFEKIGMDPILVASAFHHVSEVVSFSYGSSA